MLAFERSTDLANRFAKDHETSSERWVRIYKAGRESDASTTVGVASFTAFQLRPAFIRRRSYCAPD